jgi:multicomponent Na+:H+ antiporter subunit C
MTVLAYGVAGYLFFAGLFGVIRSRNLVQLVVCMTVVQASTYVLLLAIGYRSHAAAPVFSDISRRREVVDPVVQALTLTDVVVEAVVAALLLALAVQAHRRFGTLDPDELGDIQG